MKKYLKTADPKTFLKVEVYYSLGGINFATYQNEPRGYYLSVSPVERETIGGYVYESYVALSGVKRLVKPVSRKGKKAEQEAMLLAESCESALVNHVLGKSGLALAGGAA